MSKQTVVVVYKTIHRKKETIHLKLFDGVLVDDIIDGNKRRPLIPNDAEILDIGVGISFEERYRKKYKITTTEVGENDNDKLLQELQSIVNNKRVN